MPDINAASLFSGYTRSEITQTYLKADDNVTRRVRKRVFADRVEYTETVKRRLDKISSKEDERCITEAEYLAMLTEIKDGTEPVHKCRHTFEYVGHTVEIDVYPNWQKFCIMETELEHPDEEVTYPSVIKILYEVTGDKRYSNAGMAKEFPEEPK